MAKKEAAKVQDSKTVELPTAKELMKQIAQKEAEKNGTLGYGLHQPLDSMFEGVFEETPPHLREQAQQMLDEQKAAGLSGSAR